MLLSLTLVVSLSSVAVVRSVSNGTGLENFRRVSAKHAWTGQEDSHRAEAARRDGSGATVPSTWTDLLSSYSAVGKDTASSFK